MTDNKNMLVFGNSAMGKGIAQGLHFTKEVDDHENIKEIGGAMISGYNRNDYFDPDDDSTAFSTNNASAGVIAATSCINQSSLILMTDPAA